MPTTSTKSVEKKWASEIRPIQVALVVPSMRMMVVKVYVMFDKDFGHVFCPVVAVESSIVRDYHKQYLSNQKPPFSGESEKELLASGWWLDAQKFQRTVLFLDDECGLTALEEEWRQDDEVMTKLVACPWPAEEDESRLSEVVERLAEMLARRHRLPPPAGPTPAANG
jgi:hypothetical protein